MRGNSRAEIGLAILVVLSLLVGACQAAPAVGTPVTKAGSEATTAPQAKPAATAAVQAATAPATGEPYKVGSVSAFTGAIGAASKEWVDGINVVVEQVNAAGGINGHPIEVIFEDDGSDATKATTALTKLIRTDNVLAVVGPGYQAILPAAMQLAEREKSTPVVLGQMLPAHLRANLKWTFTQMPSEEALIDAMIDILKWKGYKKIVSIADVTPLHSDALELLKKKGPSAGIQVLTTGDSFSAQDLDLTAQVAKIKQLADKEKPDALVLITAAIMAPRFLKPMQQLGLDLPVIGPYLFGMQSLLELSGDYINGVMFSGLKFFTPQSLNDSDPQKPLLVDFVKRYAAKSGGKEPSLNTMAAADGMNIVANALKISGPDRDKLRDAIENINFLGLNGQISYKTRDGLPKESLVVYEVKDNKFVLVKAPY